jgi:hypothetical protein
MIFGGSGSSGCHDHRARRPRHLRNPCRRKTEPCSCPVECSWKRLQQIGQSSAVEELRPIDVAHYLDVSKQRVSQVGSEPGFPLATMPDSTRVLASGRDRAVGRKWDNPMPPDGHGEVLREPHGFPVARLPRLDPPPTGERGRGSGRPQTTTFHHRRRSSRGRGFHHRDEHRESPGIAV